MSSLAMPNIPVRAQIEFDSVTPQQKPITRLHSQLSETGEVIYF